FLSSIPDRLAPHPFPTRRASDLRPPPGAAPAAAEAVRDPAAAAAPATAAPRRTVRRSTVTAVWSCWDARSALLTVCIRSPCVHRDRKSTRLNSSHVKISYAVFCL